MRPLAQSVILARPGYKKRICCSARPLFLTVILATCNHWIAAPVSPQSPMHLNIFSQAKRLVWKTSIIMSWILGNSQHMVNVCCLCDVHCSVQLPVGCWPLMVGAHNLRLILQIEMQTDATGVVDTRYTYMGMSCATPDKILHSMQDNTKQLFQLPYGQHPFHCLTYCIAQWRQTPQANNLICAMIAGGMVWWFMLALRYMSLGTFVSHIDVQQNLVITGMVS